jgi:hypothetical protein
MQLKKAAGIWLQATGRKIKDKSVCCLLPVARCLLPAVCCPLPVACCLLLHNPFNCNFTI